jgi:hypothetical protein
MVDVVILSNTINVEYYNLLAGCVNSIKADEVESNIIVVETNTKLQNKDIPLPIDDIVFPDQDFNYNLFLNRGIERTKYDHILISNNDIVYEPGCISKLIQAHEQYDSVSPLDTNNPRHNNIKTITEGNEVGYHVLGYSICVKRAVLDTIGPFDEQFKFWYQDNDYCNLLDKHNLSHALIADAKCLHYGEQSHKLIDRDKINGMTHELGDVLFSKWQ